MLTLGEMCIRDSCWAVNAKASEEDIQATLEFMNWMVTDPEASRMPVSYTHLDGRGQVVGLKLAGIAVVDEFCHLRF